MTIPPDQSQPPDEGAVRTDVEWYVEITIDLGVPAPPMVPTIVSIVSFD